MVINFEIFIGGIKGSVLEREWKSWEDIKSFSSHLNIVIYVYAFIYIYISILFVIDSLLLSFFNFLKKIRKIPRHG